MTKVTYRIVPHDGGWAYTLDGVFSEPYPTKAAAVAAARQAAFEQQWPEAHSVSISWEGEDGVWHDEASRGDDRPVTAVDET
ncbi:MAG: DUF2188 domain-containing protein [Alphaproteobacteria bacterium]|jgi:hypothetical protein